MVATFAQESNFSEMYISPFVETAVKSCFMSSPYVVRPKETNF